MNGLQRAILWLAVATLGLFLGVAAIAVLSFLANDHRINDIQQSRVESCQKNYRSIEEVALFFFPPPAKRTASQRQIVTNLHQFTLAKVAGCNRQINTKGS